MAEANKKLHVAMFPWLAFGHINPFMELAKLIAEKGHRVSFISTPRNIDRLPKLPPNLAPHINLVKLTFSPAPDNLPANAESTTDIPPNMRSMAHLKKAHDSLQQSLALFLQSSAPDWVICDFAAQWLPQIAAKLHISCAFFATGNAWSICFLGSKSRTEPEHYTVPPNWLPFPSKLALRLFEARKFCKGIKKANTGFDLEALISGCDVIFVRSCLELEANWLNLLGDRYQKPVVPVGLLPPRIRKDNDGGDDDEDGWLQIREWLCKQDKGSVVYAALGSEATPSHEELSELALGLELSGLPFFWALRTRHDSSIKLPNGFEDRVKGRGVVWTSWSPQVRIMGHESVGCFLTHCGWSSVIEGLYFGQVLVMLPLQLDQGLNARVMGEEEVGIEIARDEEDGSFTRNSVAESLRLVMVEEMGRKYRDKARKMRKITGDKDRHDEYADYFLKYLQDHTNYNLD